MESLTKEFNVSEEQTAEKVGSGDLAVLATPSLVAMLENTAKELLAPALKEDETSVGFLLELKHRAPSPVGAKIVVKATLENSYQGKIDFVLEAFEKEKLIATAQHQRVIVKRAKFMAQLID